MDLFFRKYEAKNALNKINFEIGKGEMVGYIGPNGAGKSTTIKIMTGILKPSSGRCTVLGLNPTTDRLNFVKRIGAVFGNRSNLIWDLPVIDSINLMKSIYTIPSDKFERNKKELIQLMGIDDFIQTPVRQLSLGQRMRCEIIVALLHDPEILFLDEPTLGLDARSKLAVHNCIKKINEYKKITIVLTTHDMSDIDALAKRVIIIGKGKKLFDGEFQTIKNKFEQHKKMKIVTSSENCIFEVKKTLKNDYEGNILSIVGNEIIVDFPNINEELIKFITEDMKNNIIIRYQIDTLTIEEIVSRYYSELEM